MGGSLSVLDSLIILIYILIVLSIGFYFRKKSKNSEEYFLAGRKVGWIAIGASLFATNISSEHFLGLAGTGSKSGLAVGHFEWLACLILLLLGWVFTPFYIKSGVFTMPEFLEKRYNSASRYYLSIVSILSYILTKISISLYAGGILLNAVVGWDMVTSAVVIVIITGIYTLLGGLSAVIYTDLVQMFILIIGSIILTLIGLSEAGGWANLVANTPADFWSMFKPLTHPDFPWTGIIFGAPILGIWYWCTDQYIVQRVLSAKNLTNAQSGTIFAGYLKILPVFILVLPGIIAFYISGGTVSGDRAYPWLVTHLLPSGIKGIVVAGLLAALMSSLSAMFNSTSTLLTIDVFKKLKPDADEKMLVRFGRISTGLMVILGLLWIPFIGLLSDDRMYVYLQSVQAYVSPPIAAVFLFGLLSSRVNGKGAIAALLTGLSLGVFRLIIEVNNKIEPLSNEFLKYLASINFLHYAIFLFIVSSLVLLTISSFTERPSEEINSLLFNKKLIYEKNKWLLVNSAASILLVLLLLLHWWIFR
ncbi:Putative symporter [Ignavibacterium album JCM 16511]|uniref:Putative symporter n=1 Tax=Ignavibacterium album (strain DSM 19864 / JCM 16511 / NBRC 101810 / Mat9-16) TaxID=945713 RepID=I0AMS2_IGNAJ|nr:sodium:solute symporter [Ignavibacterium album]AFH50279.1 Putative symporter [Ignavibacterium album JCM 16511]